MKKFVQYFIVAAFCLAVISCSSAKMQTLSDGKQIDRKLIGTWVGSESDKQIEGMHKEWEMQRNNDGTFVLDFKYTLNGKTDNSIETGKWWVENGKFYELHKESGKTDVYEYTVKDKDHIKFKSVNISIDMSSASYEFIDTRKNPVKNKKDGLSFETAVKVNSVPEEYQFIKNNCSECEVEGQAMTEHNGRPFDIITAIKADGTKIKYHFDIKSFYGKFY